MKIKKRNGTFEKLSFDRISYRLKKLSKDPNLGKLNKIDIDVITQKVVSRLYDEITSSEIDEESARIAINMIENEEYPKLAARIVVSNLHKNTIECFSEVMGLLHQNIDSNGNPAPIVSDVFMEFVTKYKNELNEYIDYTRDYMFDYFGFKTLEKSYLFKINGKVVERPQHMYMRVAVALNRDNLDDILKTYDLISQGYYTHASPTLFNAGKNYQNFSSCFLLGTEDSMEGIFKTISDCAIISKMGGGIGVHISNIRAKGSVIRKTNGKSDGIVPMLKVYNETSCYSNQSGARKGSFAIYLEPWHADIMAFLDLRKNQGHENVRARDLFYALWIPDLFMEKIEKNEDWYLMCPDECPGLSDVYGEEFEKLYNKYVQEKRYKAVIKAQEVWFKVLEAQIETGTPYLLYKDSVNKKSNQKNVGVIKSSNLCSEITLVSNDKETAVCNLASIALPKYIETDSEGKPFFNHQKLYDVAKFLITPMNRVIDYNYYPTKEAELSNFKHRPLGIGIQGLHDVFIMMKLNYSSEGAKKLNKEIFETIYYATLSGSNELAKKYGPYETFQGSPMSEGVLQFDMWENEGEEYLSGRWDWNSLKEEIKKHGVRNSMLTTCMPTASTAQILGNCESIEPFDSCIFKRRVLSGEYLVVNKHLIKDLLDLKLWNKDIKDLIIANGGSVQNIDIIPQNIKNIYKTVWEISMKDLINLSADRARFIDHTQSLNLFIANPNFSKLTSMHFYGWKKGLKTGIYYLRSKGASDAGKFSVDPELERRLKENEQAKLICSLENKEECMMCSS
jgi:ribonucleoside-diphosphate reductase alpha chain